MSAYNSMQNQLICTVTFPPQVDKYQVFCTSQYVFVTPHPANLSGMEGHHTWTFPISGPEIWTALDLDHPLMHWLHKVKRHYRMRNTMDMNNEPSRESDNLMEKRQCKTFVNNDLVLEESNISEEKDTGEVRPPEVEDDFTPHQLKSKRRRGSLPHRFKMDDSKSIILHP